MRGRVQAPPLPILPGVRRQTLAILDLRDGQLNNMNNQFTGMIIRMDPAAGECRR